MYKWKGATPSFFIARTGLRDDARGVYLQKVNYTVNLESTWRPAMCQAAAAPTRLAILSSGLGAPRQPRRQMT